MYVAIAFSGGSLSKAQEFNKTMEAFKTAHANYHSMLSDEDEIQDSQDYYESEHARIAYFQETLNKFITKASAENYESEVRPEDSISNVGSRTRAHRTRHLGNQVVAPWLMCIAQDWLLLQKGQLYKQMP